MLAYYLYHQHPNGRFSRREVIEATDDAQAVAAADREFRGEAMELWLGARKVKDYAALTAR